MPRPLLGILLALMLWLMLIVVTRMTSTFYVIHTEGFMEIKRGRCSKDLRIHLSDIQDVDIVPRSGVVAIIMKDGKHHFLTPPANTTDFIKCIEKYRTAAEQQDE